MRIFPSHGILELTRELLQTVFPKYSSSVDSQNYTLDILKWAIQRDGYSCGFYVISVVMSFALSTGYICKLDFMEYAPEQTEKMRHGCIRAFVKAFTAVAKTKADLSDSSIMQHIYLGIRSAP